MDDYFQIGFVMEIRFIRREFPSGEVAIGSDKSFIFDIGGFRDSRACGGEKRIEYRI